MIEFAIEGHDGSAKTPIALGVKEYLTRKGIKCNVFSPFHIANSLVPENEIYSYWKSDSGSRKAIKILERVINKIKSENKDLEVIIYDRHWLTVIGEVERRPRIKSLWKNYIPTFFIEAPVEKTLSCKRFSFNVPWTNSKEKVDFYYNWLLEISKRYNALIIKKFTVRSREQPIEPIVRSIGEIINKKLKNI